MGLTPEELARAKSQVEDISRASWIDWGGGVACAILGFLTLDSAIKLLAEGHTLPGLALLGLPIVGVFAFSARRLHSHHRRAKSIVDDVIAKAKRK